MSATLLTLGAGAGCRRATEIVVDIHTDVSCVAPSPWRGVALYVGAPGTDVESRAPALTSRPDQCDARGHVGSTVIIPSDANDALVSIRVVAGITRAPEECAAAGYDGCIVARRTLSFIPQESIKLDIGLTASCIGLSCNDALRTCLNGACADPRLTSIAAPAADASAGPTVRCGNEGLRCPANDIDRACCITPSADRTTLTGKCGPTVECTVPSFPLLCDKPSDCLGSVDDAGQPFVCCLATFNGSPVNNSQCVSPSRCSRTEGFHVYMCEDKKPCFGTLQCRASPTSLNVPGYYVCDDNL